MPKASARRAARVASDTPAEYTAQVCPLSDDEIIARAECILFSRMERGLALTDPAVAGRYMATQLHKQEREVFVVLFLDNRHRLIASERMFFGTVDGCEVHPREVVKAALRHNACAVILGHNHPSGDSTPSAADRALTARLKQCLDMVDVRVLDHFIVAQGNAPVSMAAMGLV